MSALDDLAPQLTYRELAALWEAMLDLEIALDELAKYKRRVDLLEGADVSEDRLLGALMAVDQQQNFIEGKRWQLQQRMEEVRRGSL